MPDKTGTRLFRASALVANASRTAGLDRLPLGLAASGLHELVEDSFAQTSACIGFALATRTHHARTIRSSSYVAGTDTLVVVETGGRLRQNGGLNVSGIGRFGLDPGHLVHVRVRRDADALWAGEEALRSGVAGLVVIRLGNIDFTSTRRLSLVCAQTGTPGVLVLPSDYVGASAASGRWRVASRPSSPALGDPKAPGNSRWRVCLERSREQPDMAGTWVHVEWDHEALCLRMVSGVGAGQAISRRTAGKEAPSTPAVPFSQDGVRRRA